jgi:hypothetical protein
LTVTFVAAANGLASVMDFEMYAMIGIPTPHVDPSP